MTEITADRLTLEHAPKRRPEVTAVELDGEAVLYAPHDQSMHKLDRLGTFLWNCLDGTLPIAALVEDAKAVYGPTPAIDDDILAYVQDLGRKGFLVGVAADEA